MSIWDRLETLIKSYLYDKEPPFGASERKAGESRNDPDLDAAYDELDDFLRSDVGKAGSKGWDEWKEAERKNEEKKRSITEETRRDFAELDLSPEATWEECKDAYKKLLKIHHPDRHAKHEGNMDKATNKTMRVNNAYERLKVFFQS
jgi:DnaJ-domain-containing protein 1